MSSEVVYVGQTIQDPQKRDRQHRHRTWPPFDVSNDTDGKYEMFKMADKIVTYTSDIDEDIGAEDILHTWPSAVEVVKIEEYETFRKGLNFTRGWRCGGPSLSTGQVAKKKRYLIIR